MRIFVATFGMAGFLILFINAFLKGGDGFLTATKDLMFVEFAIGGYFWSFVSFFIGWGCMWYFIALISTYLISTFLGLKKFLLRFLNNKK
jgi:hypothetical protein